MVKSKKFLFFIIFLFLLLPNKNVTAQSTILGPGDVAIIQFNSDSSYFSFVLLKPITPATSINFTDRGWKYDVGINYTGEQVLYWSNTTSGTMPSGTVITMTYNDTNFSDQLALSKDGDQIFIFQGTYINPTILFGINFNEPGWVGSANSGNNSALPPTLDSSNSINAVEFIDGIFKEYDNGIYKGITRGTPAELMAAIVDVNNWELSDGSLSNTLPTSFDTSPTFINKPDFDAKSKNVTGFVWLSVLSIIIIFFIYVFLNRSNFKTK